MLLLLVEGNTDGRKKQLGKYSRHQLKVYSKDELEWTPFFSPSLQLTHIVTLSGLTTLYTCCTTLYQSWSYRYTCHRFSIFIWHCSEPIIFPNYLRYVNGYHWKNTFCSEVIIVAHCTCDVLSHPSGCDCSPSLHTDILIEIPHSICQL